MSDNYTAFGFIIFNNEGRILLLKGNTGWELPVVQDSSLDSAVDNISRKLHISGLKLKDTRRGFGPTHFQFATLDTDSRALSLPHTGYWRFGRFASFEEAWHIGRGSQENVVGWSEKMLAEAKAAEKSSKAA